MSDLPTGWALAAFEDLFDRLQYGLTAKASADAAGTRFLRITDIDHGKINWDAVPGLAGGVNVDRYLLSDGDFVFARSGSVEKAARILSPPNAVFASYLIRGRPIEPALADWLAHFVWSTDYLAQIADRAAGIGMSNVSAEKLKTISVPLPPLAEQRRIVAKLDSLTARTARARADLDRISGLASRYKQAVLTKAFNGELTAARHAAEFVVASLSEVLQSTFYGPRFGKEAYCETGVPTLRTTDFDDAGRVRPKEPPRVSVSTKDFEKWSLQDGDLLITRTGSIGKCAVYETSMGPALPSAYLIRTRLRLDRIIPRFTLLFLLSPSGQEQLGLGITAVTQPNINARVIERLRLPIPSLAAQAEVIAKVDTMFAEIDRKVAEAVAARRLLERLNQAVLAKAFRGELLPQDLADEPASVLLDRIRAERANAPKATRGRRKAVSA